MTPGYGVQRNADLIIRHPNYTGQTDNDIALIHLSSPLVFDPNDYNHGISSILYATPAEDPLVTLNMPAMVSGWGATYYNSSTGAITFTDYLFAADVKISSVTSSYIYTSSTGSSQQAPCYGDSGGPLVIDLADFGKVLVGIVNGWGDCNTGVKGYAKVSSYSSWITQNTGISRMFYNKFKIIGFQKNDCSSFLGDPVEIFYSVPANKYNSTISQADADAKAMLEINQNGQQNANINGLCYITMAMPSDYSSLPHGEYGSRYVENINWNANLSSGDSHVKIELLRENPLKDQLGRYTGGYEYVLQQLINPNAPNTGQLLNGLDSDLLDLIAMPADATYRIKITAANSGVYYLSDGFDLEDAGD